MSPTYMNPPFILHTNTCLCRRVYVFLTNMYMYNAQPSHSKPKKVGHTCKCKNVIQNTPLSCCFRSKQYLNNV